MDEYYNKHYIRVDDDGRIIHGFSDAFEQPHDGDVCINEQGGYQFRLIVVSDKLKETDEIFNHAALDFAGFVGSTLGEGGEYYTRENPSLRDDYGVPLYIWDGSAVVRRSDETVIADRPEPGELPPDLMAFLAGQYAGFLELT